MANLDRLNNELKFRSELETKRLLEREGKRLEDIAKKIWRQYLSSYSPSVYIRTNNSERGIKLGRVFRIDNDHFGIELTFVNELMYHDSWFDKMNGTNKYPKGHAIMLISDGWRVKSGKHKDIYRFGYFEGINYLGRVESADNSGKPSNVTLEVQWSGNYLK